MTRGAIFFININNINAMTEGCLRNGEKMFVIRIEHFVTQTYFAKHLTDYFYLKNESFDAKLTKKSAEKILKRGLFFHGLHGAMEEESFEASFEEGNTYNIIFSEAKEWVKEKYPYLNGSEINEG